MFGPNPLVISVPARELAGIAIPGSVFDVGLLAHPLVPADLRLAVDTVNSARSGAQAPIRCIARPEMFTHGRALSWLREKLGGATDHVCLSDGESPKLIPDMRNHLFTYGLHSHRRALEFKRTLHRAPELLGQFDSQVNSFHRLASGGLAVEPKVTLLMPAISKGPATVWFYGFYLNPHSAEDSAERMLSWGDLLAPSLEGLDEIIYAPLTECAVKDAGFERLLAERIAAATFAPKSCLLIRLPPLGSDLAERMRCAVDGIRLSGVPLAQARAKNIFFLGDDPSEAMLRQAGERLTLVLHHSFEYWRYTRDLYAGASKIHFHLDNEWKRPSETAKQALREAFGQAPRFVLSPRPSGEWLPE